ncbi:MAG TPA: hypothetical protein VFZ85_04375 [Jiangellaceae bacterium]
MDDSVVAWLLEQDSAVEFQTRRDLLGHYEADVQERIGREGAGAVLLSARGAHGHWGRGFYQPKWTSSHYTLLELKNLGLSRDNPEARETVALILREEKGRDGGLNPSKTVKASDACINGMALGYAAYFGASEAPLASIVDFLLDQRMADGGFNCELNRSGARHSSMHTTVCVMEGITEYDHSGYQYRLAELVESRATCVEFLLRHRLYRSERTGQPIHTEFTRLHYPPRWHFDVLRGLDALTDAGVQQDPRMTDALDVLISRRRPDGRWAANRAYPGATYEPPLPAGTPSPWITLIALRVLKKYAPPRLPIAQKNGQ